MSEIYLIHWDGGDDDGIMTALGAFSSKEAAQAVCDHEDSMYFSIKHTVKTVVLDRDNIKDFLTQNA